MMRMNNSPKYPRASKLWATMRPCCLALISLSVLPALDAKPSPEKIDEKAQIFFRPSDGFMTRVCPKGRYLLYQGFDDAGDKRKLYSLDLSTLGKGTKKEVRFRADLRPDMNLSDYTI